MTSPSAGSTSPAPRRRPRTSALARSGARLRLAQKSALAALVGALAPRLKPNHHQYVLPTEHEGVPLAGREIADIPLDYFWSRCEEVLPDDWAMGVWAWPDPEGGHQLVFMARAFLPNPDDNRSPLVERVSPTRPTPGQALEHLFYQLRDML